jgi:hypothetical protein
VGEALVVAENTVVDEVVRGNALVLVLVVERTVVGEVLVVAEITVVDEVVGEALVLILVVEPPTVVYEEDEVGVLDVGPVVDPLFCGVVEEFRWTYMTSIAMT